MQVTLTGASAPLILNARLINYQHLTVDQNPPRITITLKNDSDNLDIILEQIATYVDTIITKIVVEHKGEIMYNLDRNFKLAEINDTLDEDRDERDINIVMIHAN
jgi:hypothetical protein